MARQAPRGDLGQRWLATCALLLALPQGGPVEAASALPAAAAATPTGVQQADAAACPESAANELVTDPRAWAARCFAVDAGPEAGDPATLAELRLDLDGDGTDELLVGSTLARGNAGGTHFAFRADAGGSRYLGSLFLHPQAVAVRRAPGAARPMLWRYRRLGAGEGLLEVVEHDGEGFVVTRAERLGSTAADRTRLCDLFAAFCDQPSGEAEQEGGEGGSSGSLERSRAAAARARAEVAQPGRAVITGEVRAGEMFSRRFGPGLELRLEPTPLGWLITVREQGRDEDLARITPPFHFVPNPRELEGWHFRNAANDGPNLGDVNAPGEEREFVFSPAVGRTIAGPAAAAAPTEAEIEAVRADGSGTLWIEDYRLDRLEPGQPRAGLGWLRFTTALRWRTGPGGT